MPKTKQQKNELVEKMTEKLGRSKSLVFADYQGLTMGQLIELRQKLADAGAEFTVTKNNLLEISLKNAKLPELSASILSGPVATLFSYEDEVAGIKLLTKALKEFQVGKIKGGVVDGEVINESTVNKLASLPSKDELRAKVVGGLGAPLYGIVGVLQANIRNMVSVIDQIRISKGGEQ